MDQNTDPKKTGWHMGNNPNRIKIDITAKPIIA
jgi:hypothetical protein